MTTTQPPRQPDSASPSPGPTLSAYVESGCRSCANALELVERVRRELPDVYVEVVDVGVSSERRPDDVFAVPTLMLDGAVVSLGTPSWSSLATALQSALSGR